MAFSPFEVDPRWIASYLLAKTKGSRGDLARKFTVMRRFDAARVQQGNNPILYLFPPR
jgi:hypothetical protein